MKARHFIVAAIVVVLVGSGVAACKDERTAAAESAATVAPAPVTTAPIAVHRDVADFSAIVQRYGPAVVNISTEGMMKPDGQARRHSSGRVPPRGSGEVPVHGVGSGFIVSPDGLMLTNAHVVAGASEVTVRLTDRREFRAQVLGSDPATDIAVLRIAAKDLPTVHLGNARNVIPGEWVVAIGSPFGFVNTVTAGIVSANRRTLPGDSSFPFIQTDVPVNPGNSGGPLFNTAGDVIGINSQIFTVTGGYQGIAFAIPIDVAVRIQKQIVSTGHATHARLGVTIQEVSQPLAQSFGLNKPEGVLVSSVAPRSAAARAGIEPGDVILRANGQAIVESGDLPEIVDQASPGEHLQLEIWRKGASRQLVTTLGEQRQSVASASATPAASTTPQPSAKSLGLVVRPLSAKERREAELDSGVVVQRTAGASAAAGIQRGDIVLSVNGVPLDSPDTLREMLGKLTGNAALLVQRGEARIFVPVNLG